MTATKKFTKTQTTLFLSLLLFLTMVLVAVFSDEGFLTVFDFKDELEQITQENNSLMRENERLQKEIQALKTDPLAVETIAREKLGLVKPGEVVYRIVSQTQDLPDKR